MFAPYFTAQTTHISDYSLGFQFMWGAELSLDFCFAADCLVLHEFYAGSSYFYYPLSVSGNEAEENAALDEIERHCRDEKIRLHFTNVPEGKLLNLLRRYGQDCTVNNRRRWRDYLYRVQDFTTYAGGKYAGQRNHVNTFKKLYPGWQFRPYEPSDLPNLMRFLDDYSKVQKGKDEFLANEEMDETLSILPRLDALGLFSGILLVDGKIAGFSAGERCGDMVIVHIEKAERSFKGVYPFLAQQFAQRFCGDGVRFLNRMDDAGDTGLRKSKLQYLPCEIVSKYNVLPKRAIDTLSKEPEIQTERLLLAPVKDEDGCVYARLARDKARNRFWGYDYRQDYPKGDPPDQYFLELARDDFRRKEEMPLGIYRKGELIGEVVLHRFGYRADVELGVRLLPEAEGQGYAAEAMRALAEYAFMKYGIETAEAKCYRENVRSDRMLRAAGFVPCGKDDTFFYYKKTPAM